MTSITPASLLQMRTAILQQNSALQKAAQDAAQPIAGVAGTAGAGDASFTGAMKNALQSVNSLQSNAETQTKAYETGQTTDIAAVMLSREQASVGFQATLQVRNKLLSAYKDIMSMPV
ncbi:flagellar hook-basal body complex protein FliE [Sphingomonas nostoxanthinifaciens]|uniref:flagellar hook-basal body complex protein FliE n=1 Tax=Sphingomonas nostoxanthinifaciens TaxID=2872652 RepID=UPI001CC1FBC0|nr:flagellar hook-basal body complex protein FliE [Sphingomonas nostoxanthinifaciens]UAK26035.1 flagellar hook-basal body complex protein FliE [Sphingomonas nostoxanthinifaciens]